MDLIESFGYHNPDGATNYNGDYWHANSVHGTDASSYANWPGTMASYGITNYDPTQYHIWTLVYNKNNSYAFYVDGIVVQSGPTYYWTNGATSTGTPVNMSFIFDATWGTYAGRERRLSTARHCLRQHVLRVELQAGFT